MRAKRDPPNMFRWWGHAVSSDLVHWKEVEPAIRPHDGIRIWSGSAVVDKNNTSGLQTGNEEPLIAFYTAARTPFSQYMAYSSDAGMTWTDYAKNPVVEHVDAENRDPKVFRYHDKWIMIIFVKDNLYRFYSSKNLKDWTFESELEAPGCIECPDMFELCGKWVFVGGNGAYMVGSFDGSKFTPEEGPIPADYGGNYYATQT